MKIDVKMLNLLGLLALVVVLGLGAIGIVMPLYEKVEDTQTQLDQERDMNENFRFKLISLTEAETRLDEVEKNLAVLREHLPDGQQTDTVVAIIDDALELSGAVIGSHQIAEATLFAPRGSDGGPASEEPVAQNDPESQIAEIDPEHLADLPPEVVAELQGTGTAEQRVEQQQAEVVLDLNVTGEAQATQFLDALGDGGRNLLVTSATMSESEVEGFGYALQVTLTIFFFDTGGSSGGDTE